MNPAATTITLSVAVVAITLVACLLKKFFFQATDKSISKSRFRKKSKKNEPCIGDTVCLKAIQYVRDVFGQKLTNSSGDYLKTVPGDYKLESKAYFLVNAVEELLLGFKDSNNYTFYVKYMEDQTEVVNQNSNTPVEREND